VYSLRLLAITSLLWLGTMPWLAAPRALAQDSSLGTLHVLLFGPNGSAMADVMVEVGGVSQQTNRDGAAYLKVPEGVQLVRLLVPRALLPAAPTGQDRWTIDLPDIPLVAEETTQLIVTLSDSGAIAGLDLQAPEAGGGTRSMQKEFQAALETKAAGTVQGTVVAAEGGAPVPGARVYVRGAPVEAESSATGAFSLRLPEGSYALSVIHPKFSTQAVPDVVVRGNETLPLRVELSPASVELDELVVTAPHIQGGIASLIAERRETTAVADVIGAEQMARSGDTSAASALARVTGLTVVDGRFVIVRGMGERYSSMTLNRLQLPSPEPTRRVVPLDIFPTGVLESVVVQKTFSPDLPGEFGGGLVQVRSRTYPDKFMANLTLSTNFNTQTHLRKQLTYEGGQRDYLGIDDGTRELPSGFDGRGKVVARSPLAAADTPGYTAQEVEALGESLPNNFQTKRTLTPLDLSLTGSIGNKWDLRFAKIGFASAVSYRNEYNAVRDAIARTIRLAGGRTEINDDFRVDSLQQLVSLSGFLDWGVEFSEAHKLKFTSMVLRQSEKTTTLRRGYDDNLGSDSRLTRLSWVERQVLLQQLGGTHRFGALHDLLAEWRYSYARASRLEPDRRDYIYSAPRGTQDYALLSGGSGNQRLWGDLDDVTHEGQLDLTQPFDIWSGLEAKVKAGGLVYSRTRDASVRRFEYNVTGLPNEVMALPLSQILTPENIGTRAAFREVSLPNDTYDASMNLQAGYGMLELPVIESLELMAGARVEHAIIEVSTFDPFAVNAPAMKARLDDVDVLPAATATLKFLEDFQARAGYSRTLNRPDLRELSSATFNDVEANALLLGSTELKRAVIDNYDLRLEWYYTSDEVFSVGAFAKQFTDPIEVTIRPGAETILSFANSPKARTMGLEFEGRKRFDFIDSRLDALYLATNFSLITSEVEIELQNGGVYKRPLQSQSPWVMNAQLGWDDSAEAGTGLAAALLYNVAGRRIRAVGEPQDGIPDQYEEPFHRVDLVLSQVLRHGFRLGLKAQNLLNSVQTWKQGEVVVRRFRRGVDVAASLAWAY
jgi:outer membrane receptor protein involved in Fe transport